MTPVQGIIWAICVQTGVDGGCRLELVLKGQRISLELTP